MRTNWTEKDCLQHLADFKCFMCVHKDDAITLQVVYNALTLAVHYTTSSVIASSWVLHKIAKPAKCVYKPSILTRPHLSFG